MVATRARRNEITIALLGLVGIIATAFISNWDKMFPKTGVIQEVYSRYKPRGNFETELRYYLEVSGAPKLSAAHEELMMGYEAAWDCRNLKPSPACVIAFGSPVGLGEVSDAQPHSMFSMKGELLPVSGSRQEPAPHATAAESVEPLLGIPVKMTRRDRL